MSRKTITITEDVYQTLNAGKNGESWSEYLSELAESHESDGEHGLNAVIDDIATETAQRTAEEVENRLTTR